MFSFTYYFSDYLFYICQFGTVWHVSYLKSEELVQSLKFICKISIWLFQTVTKNCQKQLGTRGILRNPEARRMAVVGSLLYSCHVGHSFFGKVRELSSKSTSLKVSCCLLSSSTALAIEAPPDGYRKNVGICLLNLSNKVGLSPSLPLYCWKICFIFLIIIIIFFWGRKYLQLQGFIYQIHGKCLKYVWQFFN